MRIQAYVLSPCPLKKDLRSWQTLTLAAVTEKWGKKHYGYYGVDLSQVSLGVNIVDLSEVHLELVALRWCCVVLCGAVWCCVVLYGAV